MTAKTPALSTSVSRGSAVTKRIRDDIISGALPSGSRLTETALAARYEVSRMPVRESLRALAAEGLVEIRPYAGARVAALPDDDAADLFAVRIELEAATARRAGERARRQITGGDPDPGWWEVRRGIAAVLEQGDAAIAAGDLVSLAPLNMRFHQGVAELSGSMALASVLEQISGRIEWLYSVNVTRRGQGAWSEHHQIMQAIDAGDPPQASERMRQHVQGSRDSYFTHIRGKAAT